MGLFGFGKYSDRSIAKAATELGLRPATLEEKYGQWVALKRDVETMPEQGRLAEFEPVFRELWESKALLPLGDPVYAALLPWVTVDVPGAGDGLDGVAAALAPFEELYRSNPTAFTAGLYAEALDDAAFAARGGAYADDTDGEQWRGMAHYRGLADEVLRSVDPGDDFVWWAARHAATLSDRTPEPERTEITEKLVLLDPQNIHTYQRMALHALPRWQGEDESSVDKVARRAMMATEPLLGAGGYGLVHWYLTGTGDYEVTDTVIDARLAAHAFRDLHERFPTVPVLNAAARTMSWACNEAKVLELFGSGLQAIVPAYWDADDDEEGIDLAARAYLWAKHHPHTTSIGPA